MGKVVASDAAKGSAGGDVRLVEGACLSAMRPGMPCSACRQSCPEGAIRIAERMVQIDPAACSGCGRCASICPTGAIATPGSGMASLYECARTRRAEAGARVVTCLGGLTPEALRGGLAKGDVTLIDRGWCAACPVSMGRAEPWLAALNEVNAEAAILGLASRVRVRREPKARWRARLAPRGRSADPARRALFARIAQAGQRDEGNGDPLAGLPGRGSASRRRKRAKQLADLVGNNPLPAALFPALVLRAPTRDLQALSRLCPTGALRLRESDTQASLIFDAIICIACGDCTRSGALGLLSAGEGAYAGPVQLDTQPRATCPRCRTRFSPREDQRHCDGCVRDTDLAALAHGLMRR